MMRRNTTLALVGGWIWLSIVVGSGESSVAQSKKGSKDAAASVTFEPLHETPFKLNEMPMTMIHDAADRPYLYVAAKEGGLQVFEVKDKPRPVCSISIAGLESLHVMSLTQVGDRVYLALGNHWGKHEKAGLAVIDVNNPSQARVLGVWKDTEPGAGGAVLVSGKTAYLAAMDGGLIVLDVSKPTAPRVLARLQPELAFPDARPDRSKINARGLALQKNLLFLCFDAGGMRVIDVADPKKPTEIGRFSNPAMNGRPRAYNNLVISGSLAYVTVDYVGLEILDISNSRAIKLVSWWNPWNPKLEGLRWFSSPGHANEIAFDAKSKTVLISAGRSDLVAIDVSNPAKPTQVGSIGEVDDTQATWGLSLHGDRVYLSYIRTLGIPFRADWPGVKVFRYRR
jgi:hypothetical protein